MGKLLHQLGLVADNRGDPPTANRLYQEALTILSRLGDRGAVSRTLHQLAGIARSNGDAELAMTRYLEELAIARDLDDLDGIAASHHQIGMLAFEARDLVKAEQCIQVAIDTYARMNVRVQQGSGLVMLGRIALAHFAYDIAESRVRAALKIFEEVGSNGHIAECTLLLGHLSATSVTSNSPRTASRAPGRSSPRSARTRCCAAATSCSAGSGPSSGGSPRRCPHPERDRRGRRAAHQRALGGWPCSAWNWRAGLRRRAGPAPRPEAGGAPDRAGRGVPAVSVSRHPPDPLGSAYVLLAIAAAQAGEFGTAGCASCGRCRSAPRPATGPGSPSATRTSAWWRWRPSAGRGPVPLRAGAEGLRRAAPRDQPGHRPAPARPGLRGAGGPGRRGRFYRRSIAIKERLGNRSGVSNSTFHLGRVAGLRATTPWPNGATAPVSGSTASRATGRRWHWTRWRSASYASSRATRRGHPTHRRGTGHRPADRVDERGARPQRAPRTAGQARRRGVHGHPHRRLRPGPYRRGARPDRGATHRDQAELTIVRRQYATTAGSCRCCTRTA
ncbi:tetratricopeptide repeat protein [Micromonospora sp. M12]